MASKTAWRKLITALRKNGYEQTKGILFSVKPDGTIMACAAGQAALNLGFVTEEQVRSNLDKSYMRMDGGYESPLAELSARRQFRVTYGNSIYEFIYDKNDRYNKTPKDIAADLKASLEENEIL